ncbi:hypothetical protein NO559_07700 [Dasania sp. GY-MA-18]|uniref:Holin of 3TMs, for gene-transfer release n=1 Tax=Dasania phycosphaerae TaxID=2950436 RepID=A0A9J6RLJ7_9GAMM|nr:MULTISPECIES: hypothetical protein [Dasania]MCR8922650.1 hypothetical protein [Dasania sp. GY-MA-18]MCZ0865080.1 hypothetical protein [Dasania phycosphaerae]MCZ0868806.1 hypothetical protein [Dasania phycosphaerae]
MNLKTILSAALDVAATVNPGVGAAVGLVNKFLPDDKKLGNQATGRDVIAAVDTLPAEVQASIYEKEIDFKISEVNAWSSVQQANAEADAKGSTLRPRIALMMAWAVVVSIIPISLSVAWAVAMSDNPLKSAGDNWELVTALIATPTILLRGYFGLRTDEKKARYAASIGQPLGSVAPAGILKGFMGGR